MEKTSAPPTPDGDTGNPKLLHVAECKAVRSLQVITSPLCGESGETAKRLEDATCPTCIEILAAVRPRPADIRDYEKPEGVYIRLADERNTEHKALRNRVSVPTTAFLWTPEDAITFTPPLSNMIYGDGRGLFAFTTTYDRPAFWAVRGDSSWRTWLEDDGTDMTDFVDTITENLRREFGDAEPKNDDEESLKTDEADRYPAIDLRDGYSWRRLKRVDDPDTGRQRNQTAPGGADQEAAAAQHIP